MSWEHNEEMQTAINRIDNNPHTVVNYETALLFDIKRHIIQFTSYSKMITALNQYEKFGFVYREPTQDEIQKDKERLNNVVSLIENEYNKRINNDTPPGPEIDLDIDAALKICLLHELGVIDLLRLKGLSSNNKIAKLIDFLTKEPITTGAANMALSRIQKEDLVEKEKYQSELAALKLKFGITQ